MHFAVVITLSAFLIFLVQPLIAKQILPWFGGSAAVWTTCMVFFQTALLAGYAYADWAPRRFGVAKHAKIHAVLVTLSLIALPITVSAFWKPADGAAPIPQILALLAATIGLPYVVLSATSPLVQIWFSRTHPLRDPYRLFALSNTASLVALLCYPFLVEPRLVLRDQAWGWSILYALFVLLMVALAVRVSRRSDAPPTEVDAATESQRAAAPALRTGRIQLWWLVLAATASALLLGVTNHVTENIASVPLLWLMPLTIYLLTFILCFDGQRWYSRETYFGPVLIAVGAMGWLLVDKTHQFDLLTQSVVFGAGLFLVCMFCHGELVAAKPDPRHLGRFYAIVSLGGALGSALVAFVAPVVLPSYYEVALILVAVAVLLAVAGHLWSRRALVLGLAGILGSIGIVYLNVANDRLDSLWMGRNFYGSLKVRSYEAPDSDNYHRRLVHGAILHGEQYQAPWAKHFATTYYTGTSGIGRAIDVKENASPAIRVGMIGLGVGTIATYGRKNDVFRFYEIDAQVPLVAMEYFSYLKDSEAVIDIVLGDARLSIEREQPQSYDVLAVDAFSGDAIPAHLITREAVQLFRRHLAEGGILAYHVSNRYLDLAPVLGTIAKAVKMTALHIDDYKGIGDENPIKSPSTWVLLAEKPETLAPIQQWGKEPVEKPEWRMWTDDYHNLFQVLRSWTG
ncbi:MAG: fused MFS/spermidine synthase [Betaproteobacteria bacterium]|nr:fused MFS/spermidine synthase [Betaproteobacteria bacterium]